MSKNDQFLKIEDLKALSSEKFSLRKGEAKNESHSGYQNNYNFACFNSGQILLDKQIVIKK
jgi:hypothetical protein